MNPEEERARYGANVDTEMTLLKLVDGASGQSLGAFSWFPTHGTSMSRDNKLISGDNKGAAARFFEDWATSTLNNNITSSSKRTSGKILGFICKIATLESLILLILWLIDRCI